MSSRSLAVVPMQFSFAEDVESVAFVGMSQDDSGLGDANALRKENKTAAQAYACRGRDEMKSCRQRNENVGTLSRSDGRMSALCQEWRSRKAQSAGLRGVATVCKMKVRRGGDQRPFRVGREPVEVSWEDAMRK